MYTKLSSTRVVFKPILFSIAKPKEGLKVGSLCRRAFDPIPNNLYIDEFTTRLR